MMTTSRAIHFGTAKMIKNETKSTLIKSIQQIIDTYHGRGFKVKHVLGDRQFECIRSHMELQGINLNITGRDEHVPEIERFIRTVKERARAVVNTLPFETLPHRLIVEIVYNAMFWLNCFPHKNGIHATLSPRTIVTGSKIDFDKHCKLQFGTYVQVHEQHNNSMMPRTSGAIALRPTGNAQGSYYFLSLHSGKRIARNNWTVLPMPAEVIATIHQLAVACKKYKGIVFTDKHGNTIDDNNETGSGADVDADDVTGVDSEDNENNYTEENADINEENNVDINSHNREDHDITGVTHDVTDEEPNHDITGVTHDVIDTTRMDRIGTTGADSNYEEDDSIQFEEFNDDDNYVTIDDLNMIEQMNAAQINTNPETGDSDTDGNTDGAWRTISNHGYNLRPHPTRVNNKYALVQDGQQSTEVKMAKPHAHVMMTQMSVKQGIKAFGERGNDAMLKELHQLHERKALLPLRKEDMSFEQRKKALRYLMFLKEKRDGTIKARGCADGRSQREYTTKSDTSSPTVSLEAMMISCAIDAKENRHVAIADIPGAFLHADMDEEVYMLLEGKIAELIVKLDPRLYRKYIWEKKKEKPMSYVKLKKALYGTLQAALLFWRLLSDTLIEWGFELNTYDKCVANKKINGKQCTIIWHVDDLKISHAEKKVVDDVIARFNSKFGKESPLTATGGKLLEYLGMTLDYTSKNKVKISMYEYVDKMLTELPTDMNGAAKTPAANHLFNVSPDAKKLPEATAQRFHHLVAKLLYLSRRTRQDIQTAVAFLCTCVQSPDEDDYKKLTRVMQYLRCTRELTLTIEPGVDAKWWVDSSYAVHPDMRSHSGIMMTLVKGVAYSTSCKQKLNTKSSTEAELVAIDDAMGQILWTRHFLAAQGVPVPTTTIYQDNKSTILLAENGSTSSGKRTRHLNVRYYFVTDKIKKVK